MPEAESILYASIPVTLKARIQAAARDNGRKLKAELVHTLALAYPEPPRVTRKRRRP